MNEQKLMELKESIELLEKRQSELKDKRTTFEDENAELIEHISQLNMKISDCKDILKENAEAGFKKDGEKQRLGGISIRVGSKLIYDENTALQWAKDHSLCLALDKKSFEKIAKTEEIVFVDKEEKITVCFPKEINI